MIEIAISLNQENFRTLVRGQIIEAKSPSGQLVRIALQDIGFRAIVDEVSKALDASQDEDLNVPAQDPKEMAKYIGSLEDLTASQQALLKALQEQVHSHRQWTAHERSLQKTARSHAIEQRAILMYVLERSERAKDWLRLWEALPNEQQDVYRTEAAEWMKKQPNVNPEEDREILLPAPEKHLCHETHIDDPRQERWVFCGRCGTYLGWRKLDDGSLILTDQNLKVERKVMRLDGK